MFSFDSEEKSKFKVNLENLKKYIKFYVKVLQNGSEVEKKILRSDLVYCSKDLMEGTGDYEEDGSKLETMICPDMESIKDQLKIKNKYSNKKDRISFSIQATICDSSQESYECATD